MVISKNCSVQKAEHLELTRGNDYNEQKNNDPNNDPDPHLHVLPPHLFPYTIGASTEALGRLIEVFRFVLQLINMLSALGD